MHLNMEEDMDQLIILTQLAKENIQMKNVVVVGSQWGDEGKGKIVDWLSSEADVVIRFQGGHNAGHTLVIDGEIYKLRFCLQV